MPLRLKIVDGQFAGRTLEVQPGQPFVIGRAAGVTLAVPADTFMSGRHTAIQEDNGAWKVTDLGSRNGTFVNGSQVPVAVLKDGDEVRAGSTRLLVESGAADNREPTPQEKLIRFLRHRPEPILAVVDTACSPDAWSLMESSREPRMSLFEGKSAEELKHVAPYLVALTGNDSTIDTLVYAGWGHAWATYLTTRAGFHDLRKHLRSLLMVDTEAGKRVYFRFYDPRVLRTYLGTCTPPELKQIFGPVVRFLVEDADPEVVLEFTLEAGQPRRNEVRYAEIDAQAGQAGTAGAAGAAGAAGQAPEKGPRAS